MKNFIYILSISLFFTLNIFANDEEPPVQGEISDGNEAIPFATVQIKSTTIGTASDANGNFVFTDFPSGEQILIIKAVGHKTK